MKETKIIKTIPRVLVLDKHGLYNKDHTPFIYTNKSNELENIIVGSSVSIVQDDNDKGDLAGYISYTSQRGKTGLFFGDIELTDKYSHIDNVQVVRTDIFPVSENSHKLKNIVTYIKGIT